MNVLTNPIMWLASWSFRRQRLDMYETLVEALNEKSSNAKVTLRARFQRWEERDRKRNDLRAHVYAHIERKLGQGGANLGDAIKPFIPPDEHLILATADRSGDLLQAVQLVIRNIVATNTMNSAVRGAMAQPMLGVVSMLLMSIWYGISMWPEFIRAIPRKFWPAWTLPCIDAQVWLANHWWALAGLAVVAVAYYATLDTWTGRVRTWFDRIPPWSIYRGRQASNLLCVLSALVACGMTVREALVLVQGYSTPYMRWHLARIIHRYDASGQDSLASLRTGLFSREILDRIEDAAANRTFDATLRHVGEVALNVIVRLVNLQANAANVSFLLVIGIGFVYLATVSVVGVQDATDAYMKSIGGGVA